MKKPNYTKSLLSLLILFIISCNDNKQIDPAGSSLKTEIMAEELTIETAKQWFNTKINGQVNGRVVASKKPLWDYATQYTEKNEIAVVIVPVMVEEKDQSFAVMIKQENLTQKKAQLEDKKYREAGFSTPQKLLMFKDKKGVVQTYLMKVVADIDYFENSLKKDKKDKAKNNSKDFDGTIVFFDWNETNMVEGLRYEKGKLTDAYSPDKIKKNAKIAGCSTWSYQEAVPCANLRVSQTCYNYIEYQVTSCSDFGGVFDTPIVMSTPTLFTGGGGGGSFDAISSSYRANKVDAFLSQASQYGVNFNPDERLDFIENFEDFTKGYEDLLKAIQRWGNAADQWLEQRLNEIIPRSITQSERNLLANNGLFSYRTNIRLYLWNAFEAGNLTENIMNSLGKSGTIGRSCGECRGNAVKHSAWVIRNANTFGRGLAQNLANAHEDGQIGGLTVMDSYNNNIGLSLFDTYGAAEALFRLKDVLTSGMPNNNSNGLKFILYTNGLGQIVWTKDYPNEN